MPDGDKVHDTLPGRWQPIYQQICEGHFGPDSLAHNAISVLEKDVRRLGRGPIEVIIRVAEQLAHIPTEPLLREAINWQEQYEMIDRIVQSIEGGKKAKVLAANACKDQVQELRYPRICSPDLIREITKKYILEVYIAHFAECVPLTEQHCDGVDHETVKMKLAEMRPYIEQEIDNLTLSVNQEGEVSIRRRHRSLREKEVIGLDTDLLKVGR